MVNFNGILTLVQIINKECFFLSNPINKTAIQQQLLLFDKNVFNCLLTKRIQLQ